MVIAALIVALAADAHGAAPSIAQPFETGTAFVPANPIDEHVLALLRKRGVEPAHRCSDQVFVRRIFLDVIGTLPEPEEVREFLEDRRPEKRAILIDALLQRDEFADYWALKWCDLLRVKSEFPINLWPNAVQTYHRWVRDAIARNQPYDQFVRDLLTSSGSNFRVPPVNFCRAVQGREPSALAAAAALTFMSSRVDTWPPERRSGLEALFSRVVYKETAEWKEEIVLLDPAVTTPLQAILPDGTTVTVPPADDPRRAFADWLIRPENPWFARSVANRVWAWLMDRGIVHEPDDIRPDNPPANPELLTFLEAELVNAHYDLRVLYRLILNSCTYQQASIPRTADPDCATLFACYPVRRLDAEVLVDALNKICGSTETYTSPIPEPFTYIPEGQRTITLADGSITSPFLELFGRPARDTGLESERDNRPTDAQRLHLLNSSHIQKKIEGGERFRVLLRRARRDRGEGIRALYLTILSRYPTAAEVAAAEDFLTTSGLPAPQAVNDLVWALINTKEFLYRH